MDSGRKFQWDQGNRGHIARHGITTAEVEEAFRSGVTILRFDERGGEVRALCAGKTEAGRVIQIVYTKRAGKIRVVTAHEARKLRKFYET
jgi:uncharacterized protein